MRGPTAWAVTAVLLVVATGCTAISAGEPVPGVTSGSTENTVAPPVTQPALSFGRFTSQPCQILRREQLAASGTTKDPGEAKTQVVGPECGWQADAVSGTHIAVTFLTNTRGLDALYSTRDEGFGYFAPTEVSGYPAVNTDNRKPIGRTTPEGVCFTAVAVAKAVAFQVHVTAFNPNPDNDAPCKASERIAAMVLENLRAG
ncbi:DUF3558 domain-containing protein [Allokutzneria sp. A3M-2-11 16]|uniref:DUF3558 domain-containing protein n=1 Tax=Allokutzneria sp. A3M-2-11 16 TaxID=2962043 RepID=UPI0020B6E155|nr:DUF3558 domain-containing protein [Allokutzneria sp. A3M-2-11 16]MCP3802770.1 DUF3558 domain-containing protein [Allokutzneria sp. A3M-2-11 16]